MTTGATPPAFLCPGNRSTRYMVQDRFAPRAMLDFPLPAREHWCRLVGRENERTSGMEQVGRLQGISTPPTRQADDGENDKPISAVLAVIVRSDRYCLQREHTI